MHSAFILMQLMPFLHWLESDLTVFHYGMVFKELMQEKQKGKESDTVIQVCNRALCIQRLNRGWGGKTLTYKVGEIKRFEFLILNTSFILFDIKDI